MRINTQVISPESPISGVGKRLLLAMNQLGLSQADVAKRIEAAPSYISDLVRGLKKPGAEQLAKISEALGISIDWLLLGLGTMTGRREIDLSFFRTIEINIALTKAAVLDGDLTAKALLMLLQDGKAEQIASDPKLRSYLDTICPDASESNLVAQLYNGHLRSIENQTQQASLLSECVAYFESRKPFDKLSALTKGTTSNTQINTGRSVRAAGRDYHES